MGLSLEDGVALPPRFVAFPGLRDDLRANSCTFQPPLFITFRAGEHTPFTGDESERDDESTYGRLSTKSFFLLRRCSQPSNIVSTPNPSRRSGSIAPCSCCAISTTT